MEKDLEFSSDNESETNMKDTSISLSPIECFLFSGSWGQNWKHMVFLLVLLCSAMGWPLPLYAKTHVLITVDVESFREGSPKENIWGELEGFEGRYGIPEIIDILDKHGVKGTFYLNVYEMATHGESEMRKVARYIADSGHDLQLHTHPSTMYGKPLNKFDKAEQLEILRKGRMLLEAWTGRIANAHRAGAYKANGETIQALKMEGFELDSSLSPASMSPLFKEGYDGNDVFEIDGIIEIPVSYFYQVRLGPFTSKRFLDIESTSMREFRKVLTEFVAHGSCAVNVMMHSFSLTRYGQPDSRVADKLNQLLEFIAEQDDLEAVSTDEFIERYKAHDLQCEGDPGFVPHTGFLMTYLRSWERIGEGWKNIVVAIGVPTLFGLMVFSSLFLYRKRRG